MSKLTISCGVNHIDGRCPDEVEKSKAAHPASFSNIAFDTGVIAERQRMLKIVANRIGHITSNISTGVFTHENWKDDLLLLNELLVEMLKPAEEKK